MSFLKDMKPARISSDLSYTAVKIILARSIDEKIIASSQATGFLWEKGEQAYLVTNLHNVSGWDFLHEKAMSDLGFVPNEVHIHLAFAERIDEKTFRIARSIVRATLLKETIGPLWLVHPQFGTRVDLSAVSLGQISIGKLWPDVREEQFKLLTRPMNTASDLVEFDVNAGDDAYVVGYPLGLNGGKDFPIWKRASIASEPDLLIDDLPKILVDTATRKGMSGSPVIAVQRGLISKKMADGSIEKAIGQAPTFLGVYSGRIGDDPFGVQLGIVWKAHLIDELIDGAVQGTMPWEA